MSHLLPRVAAAAVVVLGVLLPGVASAAGGSLPADPQAQGPLTICDRSGQQVTSGNIGQLPAFYRVVNSTPAPTGYRGAGSTSTLYGVQPRTGVTPGEWSSEQLTAAGRFTDGSHPSASGTVLDETVATYLKDYPLSPYGVFQLRTYLGAPDSPIYNVLYDASYIQVSGSSWTQLSPGPDDCATSGTTLSVEHLTMPPAAFTEAAAKASPHPSTVTTAGSSAPAGSHSSRPSSGSTSSTPADPAATSAAAASGGSSNSDTARNGALLVALVLLVALGGTYLVKRR